MKLIATGNQPVGPFFHIILDRMLIPDVAGPGAGPEGIKIRGRVLDADHKPIPDAMIETWQANAHGKYAHPADTQDKPLRKGFLGFGRVVTDASGAFSLTTIEPGRVPGLVESDRRATLIAKSVSRDGAVLEWNVILGGEDETAFFDL